MLRKDNNQNSQPKIKGPLIFEDNKWNNIPECIISFFNILNAKVIEIETNHASFKTKVEQNFTKQNQVINECKTMSEETQMNFNLTNQTLTANMKEMKNKLENQNTMMRIKMEEEIEKLNKRIDDLSRGVNMKIEDNNELLVLINKDAEKTKEMFKEAMEEQKNEGRILSIVTSSPEIVQFIKNNSGIEDQLKELKESVKKEAQNTLEHLLDDGQDNGQDKTDSSNKSGGLFSKIDKNIWSKVEKELKKYKEEIERHQVVQNELILTRDGDLKKIKEQIESLTKMTNKIEKERKSGESSQKFESKYSLMESQLNNFNENFEKIQENMNLISNTLSHKLNDKVKQRSVTPTQFNNIIKQAVVTDTNFTQKVDNIPSSNKLSEMQSTVGNNKQIELQIPTQNSLGKDETIPFEEETLEDKLNFLNQRISLLELQFNQMKTDQNQSDDDTQDKKIVLNNNSGHASKGSFINNKPWLSGQEVILKEGDNLAIKVFQKSQQINKKQTKYGNMYQNPQAMAKKYRNSILGQDIDTLKVPTSQEAVVGTRSNSHSRIKELLPNPNNMTAYYKQNYAYDSSPEKSKKNSMSGVNSANDLQFTNDLIKSQLDNYTSKAKQQLDSMKNDMSWIENNYMNQSEADAAKIMAGQTNANANSNSLPPKSRNSRNFHHSTTGGATGNSIANHTSGTSPHANALNQSADQGGHTNATQINTSTNFAQQKIPISQESPLNSYKIAKNVMKNSKIKSFRISQGVSFDAINLSKY